MSRCRRLCYHGSISNRIGRPVKLKALSRAPALLHTIDDVTTSVGKHLVNERTASRTFVKQMLPSGTHLAGEDGYDRLTAFCNAIEARFAAELTGSNGVEIFEGLRRISGRIWVRAPLGHEVANRAVSELSTHRYCDWSNCRDPSGPPRGWTKYETGLLARMVVLSEMYANALATRRRIGKGKVTTVTSISPLHTVDHPSDLDEMLQLVDERSNSDPNWLSTVGAQGATWREADADPWIVAARFVEQNQRDHEGLNGSIWHDPLVTWQLLNTIGAEIELLAPLDEGLDGFTLIDLRFVLDMASTALKAAWTDPPSSLTLSGYALCSALPYTHAAEAVADAMSRVPLTFGPVSVEGVQRALTFLDAERSDIDLDLPLAQRPFRRVGDVMLYDAVHVYLGGPTLWDITLPERARDRRSRMMEPTVHEMLAKFGPQPWPSGKVLKAGDTRITDIDACVIVGNTLIVVDCYASPWSANLDRGLHSAVRNRLDNLRRKLNTWDQRWSVVATAHREHLPPGITSILPVVVSTQTEWIDHNQEPHEWLRENVPRFCTAAELMAFLESAINIERHPAAIHV